MTGSISTTHEWKELAAEDIAGRLRPRDPMSHKGCFGHGVLVAGKSGMAGAAILAGKAAMRSGIGKLTIRTPEANRIILQICLPEAILDIENDCDWFSSPLDLEPYSALGIGCGIGLEQATQKAFRQQMEGASVPMVVDADGLNILGMHPEWMELLPSSTILTPHKKELRGLIGATADEEEELEKTLELATGRGVNIVMKGHRSRIVTADGAIYVNPTGNAGMATAGSGDVLTGVILALLAQGYIAEDAAIIGVYIHGLAGDLAKDDKGEISLIASDIVEYLPKAFETLTMTKIKNL